MTVVPSSAAASENRSFPLGILVHDVSRLRSTVVDKALKPFGVTRSQWWVLTNLAARDGCMTQTEVAGVLEISKVALGELLDRLELGGLILRLPNTLDLRCKRINVTARGESLLLEIQHLAEALNAEMIREIDPSDVSTLQHVLVKLKERLLLLLGGSAPRSPGEALVPEGSSIDSKDISTPSTRAR